MSNIDDLQAFVDDIRWVGDQRAANMLQAVLDQCAAAMGEDETYNFVATYVLIDAMHGAMEADDA